MRSALRALVAAGSLGMIVRAVLFVHPVFLVGNSVTAGVVFLIGWVASGLAPERLPTRREMIGSSIVLGVAAMISAGIYGYLQYRDHVAAEQAMAEATRAQAEYADCVQKFGSKQIKTASGRTVLACAGGTQIQEPFSECTKRYPAELDAWVNCPSPSSQAKR